MSRSSYLVLYLAYAAVYARNAVNGRVDKENRGHEQSAPATPAKPAARWSGSADDAAEP